MPVPEQAEFSVDLDPSPQVLESSQAYLSQFPEVFWLWLSSPPVGHLQVTRMTGPYKKMGRIRPVSFSWLSLKIKDPRRMKSRIIGRPEASCCSMVGWGALKCFKRV